MYESETILRLKEQRPKGEDGQEFAYNRVRVVGPSPINHGVHGGTWEGAAGQGVVITPLTGFASTLDEPLGKLQALYEVESLPDNAPQAAPKVRVIDATTAAAGKTPEEVFAEIAEPSTGEPGVRQRTKPAGSPLGADPRRAAADGPLGSGVEEEVTA